MSTTSAPVPLTVLQRIALAVVVGTTFSIPIVQFGYTAVSWGEVALLLTAGGYLEWMRWRRWAA
jgi:hypothetical protein